MCVCVCVYGKTNQPQCWTVSNSLLPPSLFPLAYPTQVDFQCQIDFDFRLWFRFRFPSSVRVQRKETERKSNWNILTGNLATHTHTHTHSHTYLQLAGKRASEIPLIRCSPSTWPKIAASLCYALLTAPALYLSLPPLSLSLSPASLLAPPALSPLNFDLFHVISAYKLPASEAAPLWPQRGLSLIDHFDWLGENACGCAQRALQKSQTHKHRHKYKDIQLLLLALLTVWDLLLVTKLICV